MKDDDGIAIPISIRLPAKTALRLYQYAEEMGTSSGKLLEDLLEDILKMFEEPSNDYMVKVRKAKIYHLRKAEDDLKTVNVQELANRLLKRTKPGGPMGRPRKPRKI